MALLSNIKDIVVAATDEATWKTFCRDFAESLTVFAMGGGLDGLISDLGPLLDLYGLDSSSFDLIAVEESPAVEPSSEQGVYVEVYAAGTSATAQLWARNCSLTRTNTGRWSVTLDSSHTDGVNYHVGITAEEESANRDTPDITIVQGTKTATGFDLQIVTGDNGGSADAYIDTPFTISINDKLV